jgi:hypothetical protein
MLGPGCPIVVDDHVVGSIFSIASQPLTDRRVKVASASNMPTPAKSQPSASSVSVAMDRWEPLWASMATRSRLYGSIFKPSRGGRRAGRRPRAIGGGRISWSLQRKGLEWQLGSSSRDTRSRVSRPAHDGQLGAAAGLRADTRACKIAKSIYFREPSRVPFELATDEPGFVFEPADSLGESLVLLGDLEKRRAERQERFLFLRNPRSASGAMLSLREASAESPAATSGQPDARHRHN